MYTVIQRTLLSIALMVGALDLARADDWPQWRGPERMGVSKETGLLQSWPAKGPKLLWTFRDAGAGYSSMAVVGDRLYTMGGDETKEPDDDTKEYVFVLDLKTQKKLWSTKVGALHRGWSLGPMSTPTLDGNLLYAVGGYGDLICVETTSGKKVWSHGMKTSLGGWGMKYGYTESPLVDGDLLIATPGGKKKGAIAAFDKKTGKLKWRCADCTYATAYASLMVMKVGGIRQYVQAPNSETRDGEFLVGVRASDGKLLWEFHCPMTVGTPICRNDRVYVSSMVGCWAAKIVPEGDKCKAELLYANKEMKNHLGGVVLVGDYLYGYSDKGLMCQDFKTGKTVWIKTGRELRGSGSVIYADGNLYCYHPGGDILLVKATPSGYQEQGKFRIPERSKLYPDYYKAPPTFTAPVVANGRLYLRDQELIFCYDVHKPLP